MTNEASLCRPASAEETARLQQRLLELLAWQTRCYTGADSTSVRVETAQALLDSLCFCLRLTPENWQSRAPALLKSDLRQEWQRGQRRLDQKRRQGAQLHAALCRRGLPVFSRAMADTLRSIGGFWSRYDSRFFACDIPCDIDYPLALPVPEQLLGVDYVNEYLMRLSVENELLARWPAAELTALLRRFQPQYQQLIVNLFEPVAAAAVGRAMLGLDLRTPLLRAPQLPALQALIEPLPPAALTARVTTAAGQLTAGATDGGDEYRRRYLTQWGEQLARRILALRDCGGLPGVFLTV